MGTQTDTDPALGEAPPCWPPLAHIIREEDRPVKEGTIALCGAKMMGIDLSDAPASTVVCGKCAEIALRELEC